MLYGGRGDLIAIEYGCDSIDNNGNVIKKGTRYMTNGAARLTMLSEKLIFVPEYLNIQVQIVSSEEEAENYYDNIDPALAAKKRKDVKDTIIENKCKDNLPENMYPGDELFKTSTLICKTSHPNIFPPKSNFKTVELYKSWLNNWNNNILFKALIDIANIAKDELETTIPKFEHQPRMYYAPLVCFFLKHKDNFNKTSFNKFKKMLKLLMMTNELGEIHSSFNAHFSVNELEHIKNLIVRIGQNNNRTDRDHIASMYTVIELIEKIINPNHKIKVPMNLKERGNFKLYVASAIRMDKDLKEKKEVN